jgi:hypothetical protein
MKQTQAKKFQFFFMISILVWAWAVGVRADEVDNKMDNNDSGDFIHERTYVGGLATYTGIDNGGDFTGLNTMTYGSAAPYEIELIPTISQNVGFAVLLGRREGAWAAEISYWNSNHSATFNNGGITYQGTATYQSINLDFKHYFFTQFPTQPFISVGLSLPWLVVQNGSIYGSVPPPSTGDGLSDATYTGIGFNLGAGLEIYMGQNFSIVGSITERWAGYGDVLGYNRVHEVPQLNGTDITLQASGLNFGLGATIAFADPLF